MNRVFPDAWTIPLLTLTGRRICLALWFLSLGMMLPVAAVEVPPLTGRVVDRSGVLESGDEQKIEAAIIALENATGGQMAVLLVPALDGLAIEDFGLAVMNQWRIGYQGKDNGAILILALSDRRSRLELGYGWEKQISRNQAEQILKELARDLRNERYAAAAIQAVREVQRLIAAEPRAGLPFLPILLTILALGLSGFSLLLYFFYSDNRLDPDAGICKESDYHSGDDDGNRENWPHRRRPVTPRTWFSGGSGGGGGFSGGGGRGGGGGGSGRW